MKTLKWIVIILISLIVLLFAAFQVLQYQTKKASPEKTATYRYEDTKITVFYCSPAKKGREIFGELVPYEEVWRTGANEATTFTCNTAFLFGDTRLEAGTYSLWTIPGPADWTVILNSKQYSWGVNWDEKALREPEYDVAVVNAPVQELEEPVERLNINFEYNVNLIIEWDRTKVSVPIAINQ